MNEFETVAVPGTVKEWFGGPVVDELDEAAPDGPWNHEPSKIQWVDKATGLPCLIVRSPHLGHLCGYAGVYLGHPLHGVQADKTPDLSVHGGVTFAAGCAHGKDESQGICHIPEPGTSDDVWWIGFDCAHLGDLSPGMLRFRRMMTPNYVIKDLVGDVSDALENLYHDTYRDVPYVRDQVTHLAHQLKELA
jgi:hypothetical protein